MISILTWGKAELLFRSIKFIVPMPPSWIAGFYSYAPLPFRCDAIPILLPVTAPQPMTPEYIDQVHTSVNAEAGIYIPAVLKELARKPEYVDHMRHMKWVGFVGAPLDQETGNVFTSFLRVQPLMGSTEVGGYGLLLSEQDEWMYYNFGIAPETGFRFLPYQDDLYESVVVRHTDPIKFGTQVIFHVFPDLDVYHTKDVWREHPTKKGLWLMCGRTDDFVKLANLTKFNATHIEATLLTNPMVQAIVVGGEGRKTPFLLIELADEEMDENEALGALWPLIEERNKEVSWEIRLKREMVMFAKKGKPLKKVGAKGTTNRRATIEGYAKEIEELYGRNAALMNGGAS
jgi:acyl-coenzyme A synthetase/AMP-(fatty) acid ligase